MPDEQVNQVYEEMINERIASANVAIRKHAISGALYERLAPSVASEIAETFRIAFEQGVCSAAAKASAGS